MEGIAVLYSDEEDLLIVRGLTEDPFTLTVEQAQSLRTGLSTGLNEFGQTSTRRQIVELEQRAKELRGRLPEYARTQ